MKQKLSATDMVTKEIAGHDFTMTRNAHAAADNYLMWLKNYPGDYKGASDAAGDFLDTEDELYEVIDCFRFLSKHGIKAVLV